MYVKKILFVWFWDYFYLMDECLKLILTRAEKEDFAR